MKYLEVWPNGRFFASGLGRWNGQDDWGWCVIGRDRPGDDRLEVRLVSPADVDQGCPNPTFRFVGPLRQGDVDADAP